MTACSRCRTGLVPPDRPAGLPLNGYLGKDARGIDQWDDTLYQPVRGMGTIVGLCLSCLQLTCPDCAQEFRNATGHCRARFGGCCRSFADKPGDSDRHLVRDADGTAVRCATDEELLAKGWSVVDGHYWMRPGGAQDRARLAASRRGFAAGGASNG